MIKTHRASDVERVSDEHLIPSLEGLDREQLRQAVYRRVFGDADPVKVGRYTVLERIGRGGMGVVFKAYDTQLDRKVAVKVIHTGVTDKFLIREAKALARLSSPNVVQIYEVGHAGDGELFLAMEFIDGPTLRDWLAQRPRTWREILDACIEAGEGLAAAHRAGLVHRDFKPENVMVGGDGRTRVLDFGLARTDLAGLGPAERRERLESLETTLDGRHGAAGTPAYMAPEQLTGGTLGPATDQFAFCATAFEALYGVRPFPRTTLAELLEAIQRGAVHVPQGRGNVPRSVHRALLRGLQADPEQRFPSMRVLLAELHASRRSRRWFWLGGAATLASVAALGMYANVERLGLDRALADASASVQRYHEEMEILLTAEARLDSDPTAALEALDRLPDDSKVWSEPRVGALVEQAEAYGLAQRQLEIDPSLSFVGFAGDRVLLMPTSQDRLLAVDTRADAPPLVASLPEEGRRGANLWLLDRVAISPSGRHVVRPGQGLQIIVDLAAGTHVSVPGDVGLPVFSGDGRLMAATVGGETVVRRLGDGESVFSIPKRAGAVALDETGARIAVGGFDGPVEIFDIATGERRALETGTQRLAFIPGSRDLLVAGVGIYRWDTDAHTRRPLAAADEMYREIAVSSDGARAVAISNEGVRVIDLDTATLRRWDHADGGTISDDGRWLAFIDPEGHGRVVDLDSGLERLLQHTTAIREIAFATDGVLTRGSDRVVRRWPLVPERPGLRGHEREPGALAFSPDGEVLYSGGRDRTVRRWDLATGETEVLGLDVGEITYLVVSPDGRHIASRTAGHTVTVRECRGGAVVDETAAGSIGFLPDGDLVIAAVNGLLRKDLTSGNQTSMLAETATCGPFAISPSGERLVASCEGDDGTVRTVLWSIATGERIASTDLAGYRDFAFDGTESRIIARNYLEPVLMHDFDTGRTWVRDSDPWGFLVEGTDPTNFVGRGPSGGFLVRGRSGATIDLPRSESADMRVEVAVSADGRRVAATSRPGAILVRDRPVPTETDALRDWVRQHVVSHGTSS